MMQIFANVYETKTVFHFVTKIRYTHTSITTYYLKYLIIFISYSHIIISHTCTDDVKFYYYITKSNALA